VSAEIVTVANRIPSREREPYYRPDVFFESLRRFAITPGAGLTVLGMNEEWRGLMTKPRRLRNWLRAGGVRGR
jgi:hypothetical protein